MYSGDAQIDNTDSVPKSYQESGKLIEPSPDSLTQPQDPEKTISITPKDAHTRTPSRLTTNSLRKSTCKKFKLRKSLEQILCKN